MSNASVPEYQETMIDHLGIQFLPPEKGFVRATMPVDRRTCQPFGLLSGGASLALAETLAGYGSYVACDGKAFPCGIQVSGNHVSAAYVGDTVTAEARLLHQGKRIHVWNVDIVDGAGKLVSSARVINQMISNIPVAGKKERS